MDPDSNDLKLFSSFVQNKLDRLLITNFYSTVQCLQVALSVSEIQDTVVGKLDRSFRLENPPSDPQTLDDQ